MWLLIKDAWRANSVWDKMRIWFMPTGWRPADVEEKYPVFKIDNPYDFEKYNPKYSKGMLVWSLTQMVLLLGFISYLFGNIAEIGSPGMFIYGAFVFLFVYAYTELMDRNENTLLWESLKSIMGIALIYYLGDWFGANQFIPWMNYVLITYFIISIAVVGYFVLVEFKSDEQQVSMSLS